MSDCYNHLFGQCVNTVNTKFISGGSSGGEASLVASLGSIVGIGSDLGGSVRIPAALCGIYGLSPTTGRHPYEQSGYVCIETSTGFSGTSYLQTTARVRTSYPQQPGR